MPIVFGGGGGKLSEEADRLFCEQPDGQGPLARPLKEGWVLQKSSHETWLHRVLHRSEAKLGGRRLFCRLTADALALYEDRPGSSSGKGKRPLEVIFISSVSAILGREKGSESLRIIVARGQFWELRPATPPCAPPAPLVPSVAQVELEAWATALVSRLGHFRQAKRQSQRITKSALKTMMDGSPARRSKWRRYQRMAKRYLPCCRPCIDACCASSSSAKEFSLTSRLSGDKEPEPFKGPREGHNALVDAARLAEVTDPELQEAQGAHWSDQAVRYLRYLQRVPEGLSRDFKLTLRMGAPDGLKRLIWPLAAGEAVEAPRAPKGGADGASASTVSEHRDPGMFYDNVCQRAFGGVRPDRLQDPVPTFCQGIQGLAEAPPLRQVVRHLGLMTPEGEEALRRLLWCVQLTCHSVEFCPFMPNLCATLLPFFSEAETMMLVSSIIREAEREPEPDMAANPRIIWSRQQLNKQAKLFVREAKKKTVALEAVARLEELGLDIHAVSAELLQDGLAHCLPFRALCRLVGSFLSEGSEVILRYGLALMQLRSADIVACKSAEEAKRLMGSLGEVFGTTSSIDLLTKAAFSFVIRDTDMSRFSSQWGSEFVAPKMGGYQPHIFCRPRLFPPRGHCPDSVWEAIWAWVPSWCRVLDPHLIYSPSTQGTSLRTLLEICKKKEDTPMVFFVYTKEGDIIGGFSPTVWVRTNGYLKLTGLRRSPEDAFVFRRLSSSSRSEVFTWSGMNEMLMDASELRGLSFGGDGAAIFVQKDMVHATTSVSATFNSPMLVAPDSNTASARGDGDGAKAAKSPENEGGDGEKRQPQRLPTASSVTLCGAERADFEMLAFEVFALQ